MSTYDWDSVARRYVEHDTLPMTTFGPLGEFGEAAVANNNRAAMGAGMSDVDPDGLFLAATRETQGGGYSFPRRRKGGPYISTLTGRFYPFDPDPADVDIAHIAHSLAMSCRYTGACIKYYSTAEHSVHIARWLIRYYSPSVALSGLLHDAPESLSGFGDTARPSKQKAPIIKDTEESIYRLAVAPAFSLPPCLPEAVHEADSRIIADEMQQNMHECDPSYNNPLGVRLEYWSPEVAEEEFLAAFYALQSMSFVAA